MKKTYKLALLLALGTGVMTLQSCKEDEGSTPEEETQATIMCYPTTVTEQSTGEAAITTTYEYNSSNQLVKSIYMEDGETYTSTYEYDGSRLITMNRSGAKSTLVYTDADDIPDRINTSEDGEDLGFSVITTVDGKITKVEESYFENGEAVLDYVTNLTYTDGEITGAITENYDPETETFETELEFRNMKYDGKKNPYSGNFAFLFEQEFNPLVLTKSNIVSADLVGEVDGEEQSVPYTGTYTYNGNDYPETSKQTIAGFFGTDFTYEYDCK